jgi:antitoxin VapB
MEVLMPYHIKDKDTDRVIRELATIKGKPIVDVIREVCQNELRRERRKTPLAERIKPLQQKIAAAPRTGDVADKDFFDDLSGD